MQHWIKQAQQLDLTAPRTQRGLLFLQYLLAALTPQETILLANYPNPFNPETWIPYQLAKPADVTLTIYDIQGRVVRDLDLGHQRMQGCIRAERVRRIGTVEMKSVNLLQVACISIHSKREILLLRGNS